MLLRFTTFDPLRSRSTGFRSGLAARQIQSVRHNAKCACVIYRLRLLNITFKQNVYSECPYTLHRNRVILFFKFTSMYRSHVVRGARCQTKRGARCLNLNGFQYTLNKRGHNGNTYWRCTDRGCSGRATLEADDTLVSENNSHNHPPQPSSTCCFQSSR